MDKVFLRKYSTYEELGIYSVSVSFAGAAIIFQSIFSTIWSPLVYRWVNEGVDPIEIHKVSQHVLSCVLALFSILGMFSWVVRWILPSHYAPVQYLLVACMGYPLFYTLSETTVVGIGIARKSIYSMLSSVIAVIVNLIGNYLFVPKFGAAGAAIATAIAFWVFLVCRTEFASKVWSPQPRVGLYVLTFICLSLSIVSAVCQQKYFFELIVAWILLFFVNLILNLKNISALKTIYQDRKIRK
jgi:O-antigen/teichoic acid export membrane protein